MQGVPYHLNCLACSLDHLVEICRCKRAAQDGSETLMHPQQKRQNSIKSNLNWSRKLDLCNLQIFCATWLIVHIRVKDNCHVVNFELSCCKFCIYTHPVNSKFTTWHNDDVGFEDSNNGTLYAVTTVQQTTWNFSRNFSYRKKKWNGYKSRGIWRGALDIGIGKAFSNQNGKSEMLYRIVHCVLSDYPFRTFVV